jgi:Ni,Fe-hydrogenase maturation factor
LPLPDAVEIWGIEAADLSTFSERLTDAVEQAVPAAVAGIVASLSDPDAPGGLT